MITLKHDDIAQVFLDRMARDQCSPGIAWNFSNDNKSIVSITVTTAQQNRCKVLVPVTVPADVKSIPSGSRKEKVGEDPLTVWVKLNGQPVTIQLSQPVPV